MDAILSIPFLIFLPIFISILIISPLFTNNEIAVRRFSKWMFGFIFAYSVLMLIFFDSANPYNAIVNWNGIDWIQSLGVRFSFLLDNIRILLVVLTSFIFFISSLASKYSIKRNHKLYYSMLFLLLSAVLGIFASNDMFVFFMFWELELIPAYFLIGNNWENKENSKSKKAAVKFVLFTFAGSMFMLLGMLLLHYFNCTTTGLLSAEYSDIVTTEIPQNIQYLIAFCFILGFGVKLPIIPLHTWLPDAHTEAPTPISIILAGILLKTGAYGLYMFNYKILNDCFGHFVPTLAIFAFINIIYTAFIAYSQTDIKRIVAYSSISNMGLILLGLCSCNQIGLSASFFHIVAHALVTAGLFMLCGIVYIRCKTRNINELNGIATKMPRLFAFAILTVMASIGVPLFAPFIGEILTVTGALFSEMSVIIKAVSVFSLPMLIISSCYMLKFLHKSFYGNLPESMEKINDISVHEFIVLASITAGLIILGIYPSAILNFIG